MSALFRKVAMSVFVSTTMLAGPLSALAADETTPAATQAVPAAATQDALRETVEQRISSLHTSLAITPAEEEDWNGVTKAMRQSAAVMDKLVAENSAKDSAKMTAVDNLMTYETFARAHVEGLKSLTHAFTALYNAMPDAQKKLADDLFQNFGHDQQAAHG